MGCFYFLAIMNNAVINVNTTFCVSKFIFHLIPVTTSRHYGKLQLREVKQYLGD